MSLIIKIMVCSHCRKEHSTENFQLIPMIGDNKVDRKINQVYLHDTGKLEVACECGYKTEVRRYL